MLSIIKRLKESIVGIHHSKINYVLINILVFMLRFVKSFIFMKFLNFTELGYLTIISTILSFFGMFQLGLLNGAYRIFAAQKDKDKEGHINDLVYSYFLILSVIIAIICISLKIFGYSLGPNNLIIYLAIVFGIITLTNNWISVVLSAYMNFGEMNFLELISTVSSLVFIISIYYVGFYGALLTTFSQPIIYLLLALKRHRSLRPKNFTFNFKEYKWILSFGFVPFLTGIFVQVHSQVERWSIVYFLNIEELGKFYLPSFYIVLFMIIPMAVNRLFFPQIVRKYVSNEKQATVKALKQYYLFLMLYIFFAVLITYLFIHPVVAFVFNKHLFAIKYIWYVLPGLIASLILLPIDIMFNASVNLKPMFWSYFTSVFVMVILVFGMRLIWGFSLEVISIIKSLTLIYITVFSIIAYFRSKKKLWVNDMDRIND